MKTPIISICKVLLFTWILWSCQSPLDSEMTNLERDMEWAEQRSDQLTKEDVLAIKEKVSSLKEQVAKAGTSSLDTERFERLQKRYFRIAMAVTSRDLSKKLEEAAANLSQLSQDLKADLSSPEQSIETSPADRQPSIAGRYTYQDASARLEISIYGDSWRGKTVVISGFGADYDDEHAEYDRGVVRGNDLYEETGMVKIGAVNGSWLSTSIGNQSVTLRKE